MVSRITIALFFMGVMAHLVPLLMAAPLDGTTRTIASTNRDASRSVDSKYTPSVTMQKRSSPDRSNWSPYVRDQKEKPSQKKRREKVARELSQRIPVASLSPLTDDDMIQKFDDKYEQHSRESKGLKNADRIKSNHEKQEKWRHRSIYVDRNDPVGLRKEYDYYARKEILPDYDSERRAKNTRKKVYYGKKLGIVPTGDGSSGSSAAVATAPATETDPYSFMQRSPSPPGGRRIFGSVPDTPPYDSQYYGGGS